MLTSPREAELEPADAIELKHRRRNVFLLSQKCSWLIVLTKSKIQKRKLSLIITKWVGKKKMKTVGNRCLTYFTRSLFQINALRYSVRDP